MNVRIGKLVSMVFENRPWRLIFGMRSALAAVLATSLYLVITSTIWQLSSQLSWTKLTITTLVSVGAMVVWVLAAHDLWLRRDDLREGDDAVLQNATTVVTLIIGVAIMSVTVFAFNLAVAFFFLQPPIFGGSVTDYVRLGWLASGFGTVAGAVGSGLDSDSAVLRATYSHQQRRQQEQARSSTHN